MAEDKKAKSKAMEEEGREAFQSLSLASALQKEDPKPMKVAWIAALVFHFALFLIVFPELGGIEAQEEAREAVVIKRYKPPEPPKQQPEKKVVKKKTSRVPIPDPTPDDPEPIVEEAVEYIETDDEVADTEFMMAGPPAGGPPVIDQGPMRVGGDIQAPDKIHHVPPEYPELARRARLSGVVILEATIDREGNVINVNVLRGLGLGLDEAARSAVQQWKYTPTFYNGRPVEVLLTVTVQFTLQ